MVDGFSAATSVGARSPMKLLVPRPRGPSVWAFGSSFGGGMVAGDQTRMRLRVGRGARCFLGTQASTKIYRNPRELPCSHALDAEVEDGSLLVLAPDAVQCFAGSAYEQRQRVRLHGTGSVVWIDWLSAGRVASGERWAFRRYSGCNRLEREGETFLHDSLLLESSELSGGGRFRVGRFDCLATVVLAGPLLRDFTLAILEWAAGQPARAEGGLVFSASPLREGVLLRLAAGSVESAGEWIRKRLNFLGGLLGDDPWTRKW